LSPGLRGELTTESLLEITAFGVININKREKAKCRRDENNVSFAMCNAVTFKKLNGRIILDNFLLDVGMC
jgi:hypothetical protein